MADPSARRRVVMFGVALLVACAGVAFLVVSVAQHQDAQRALDHAQVDAARVRAENRAVDADLTHAEAAVRAVQPQLAALPSPSALVGLDDRDLQTIQAAVQAGHAAKLDDFNAAVRQRDDLDVKHDAALEGLRVQVNTVITALDAIKG